MNNDIVILPKQNMTHRWVIPRLLLFVYIGENLTYIVTNNVTWKAYNVNGVLLANGDSINDILEKLSLIPIKISSSDKIIVHESESLKHYPVEVGTSQDCESI